MLQSTLLRDLVLLNSRNREMEYCEGSNMRNVNVGILGCGVISNTYIRDIKRFYPTLHLAACADVNVELAKSHAEKYQISAGCSVEEMLATFCGLRSRYVPGLLPADLQKDPG